MATENQIRSRFKAEAADHPGNGHQAIVRSEDPDTGEVRAVFMGKAEHKSSRDAIKTAKVWIDAEVGRVQRLEILTGRRRDELPEILEKNIERADDLKSQRADINTAIKSIETENALLVRETCHPEIKIIMYEGTGTYAYSFVDRGNLVEVDDRQLGLFSDGVSDSTPEPDGDEDDDDGEGPPDIHDLAGDSDGPSPSPA